jgi:hypothetical protein
MTSDEVSLLPTCTPGLPKYFDVASSIYRRHVSLSFLRELAINVACRRNREIRIFVTGSLQTKELCHANPDRCCLELLVYAWLVSARVLSEGEVRRNETKNPVYPFEDAPGLYTQTGRKDGG